MADRCGTSNTLTIGQSDPDCGCSAEAVVKATPILTSGVPAAAPLDCEPNIAYDVTNENIYFYYNGSWHLFPKSVPAAALDLCTLSDAATVLATDKLSGCFQGSSRNVGIDDLKDFILDLCGLTDVTSQVTSGNTKVAACVNGNDGLISPYAPICATPNTGDVSGGDEVVVCAGGTVVKKTFVDPDPCLAPSAGNLDAGDTIVTCGPGGMERKVYVEPDPCTATMTGDLDDGDVVLTCGPNGMERKEFNEVDLCGTPDGGSLQDTDRVLTCRNGDIVRANVGSGVAEACNTRIRAEDNDPFIEVVEESTCGDCCGFVIKSKCPENVYKGADSAGGGICVSISPTLPGLWVYQSSTGTVTQGGATVLTTGTPGPLVVNDVNPFDCDSLLVARLNGFSRAFDLVPGGSVDGETVTFLLNDDGADDRAIYGGGNKGVSSFTSSIGPYVGGGLNRYERGSSAAAFYTQALAPNEAFQLYGQWWLAVNVTVYDPLYEGWYHGHMEITYEIHKGLI